MKMKRKNILMLGCLAGLLLLSACSSEENMADTGNKIDVAKGIRFQFTEEGFEPGEVAAVKQGTRALAEPQEIDLGNGIIAEATLEPDTAGCAQTRAGNPVPDGTYKIYAIDAGGTRHDGLTGTMTGGVFTPSGHWELEAGTYTFVCINSAVTDNGNELYVKLNDEDGMPLIGVSDPITVTNPFDVFVSFVMRHQQARVRYQFVSYTEPIESPLLRWLNCDPTYDVGSAYFDLKGNRLRDGGTPAGIYYPSKVIHLNQPYQPSSITKEYTYTTDYILCSPEFLSATYYAIGGTLYGRTLWSNKGVVIGTFQKNHSYIWKLKFKNKDPWYLYNDGTIGSLAKRGSRTPIGIVLEDKTATKDGTAIALDIAPVSLYPIVTGYNGVMWDRRTLPLSQANNKLCPTHAAAIADMDGYKYTWEGAGSADGVTIKANSLDYPAFYIAARYGNQLAANSITVSGSMVGRKWYLPAYGELLKLRSVFGSTLPMPNQLDDSAVIDPATMARIDAAFTAAGAPALSSHDNPGCSWTSTETDPEAAVNYYPNHLGADNVAGKGQSVLSYFQVIPFVHF